MTSMALGWIDALILVVLGGSVLVGVLRGLVFEVLSLLGWLVAWFCAQAWGIRVAQALQVGEPGSLLERGVGFALCFVGVLLGWKLLSWLVQKLIQATPLAPIDRALGAAFGLLRGGVIVLVAVTLVGLTPWSRSATWQTAKGVHWAQALLGVIAPVMPGPGSPLPGSGPGGTGGRKTGFERAAGPACTVAGASCNGCAGPFAAPGAPVAHSTFGNHWSRRCVASWG